MNVFHHFFSRICFLKHFRRLMNYNIALFFVSLVGACTGSTERQLTAALYSWDIQVRRYSKLSEKDSFLESFPDVSVLKSVATSAMSVLSSETLDRFTSRLSEETAALGEHNQGILYSGEFTVRQEAHYMTSLISVLREPGIESDIFKEMFARALERIDDRSLTAAGLVSLVSHCHEVLFPLVSAAVKAEQGHLPEAPQLRDLVSTLAQRSQQDFFLLTSVIDLSVIKEMAQWSRPDERGLTELRSRLSEMTGRVKAYVVAAEGLRAFQETMTVATLTLPRRLIGSATAGKTFREKLLRLPLEELQKYSEIVSSLLSNEHASIIAFLGVNRFIENPVGGRLSLSERLERVVSKSHGSFRTIEYLYTDLVSTPTDSDLVLDAKAVLISASVLMEVTEGTPAMKELDALIEGILVSIEMPDRVAFLNDVLLPAIQQLEKFSL